MARGIHEHPDRTHPQLLGLPEEVAGPHGQDRHHDPAGAQRPQGVEGRLTADRVEHGVHVADRLRDVDVVVVDRLVDAELAQEVVLAGAGGADHVRTAGLGDLHGHVPDAAGGGVDEHPLARLDVGVLDERLPCGQRHERQGGGLHVVEGGGLGGEPGRGGGDVLGVGSVPERVREHPEHLVAGGEARDADAHLLHHSGQVPAEHERGRAEEAAVLTVLPVGGVDAGGLDADEDLVGSRGGAGEVDDGEDVRLPEGVLVHGAHGGVVAHGPRVGRFRGRRSGAERRGVVRAGAARRHPARRRRWSRSCRCSAVGDAGRSGSPG